VPYSRANDYKAYWGLERQTFQNNVLTCTSKSESGTGKVLGEMSFLLLIFPYGKLAELTDGITACPSDLCRYPCISE
jgi:hypothetical protein